MSDCNYIWTRKWLTKDQIRSLLPDRKEDINNLYARGNTDGKFQFMPESYNYGMRDLLTYDEYWYRSYRTQKLLVDIQTGETMEWTGKDEDLDIFLKKFPEITAIDNQIQTTKLAIVVQGVVMYNGPNPMGIDQYPFVPVFTYYDPQLVDFSLRIQGIVRGLRDPRYIYNRRKVIELDILESQITSGWKYKPSSLVNPKDVFLKGQGRGLAINEDAQMTDAEQIIPSPIPATSLEVSKIMGEEMNFISGANEELMGNGQSDQSGALTLLRQAAGLTTLQKVFDQLDFSQKNLGRIKISLIQANFSPGKIKRIIGEEPSLQFYSKAFGKYDIAIEEGSNTVTQRQMQFQQLIELDQLGIKIPAESFLDAATIQDKDKILENIKKQEDQQSQIQQLQMQLQIETQKATIKDLESRASANVGLALERSSRVQENRALAIQKVAEAEKDRNLGTLEVVKGIKELDGIDLSHIEKSLQLHDYVKGQESNQTVEDKLKISTPNIEELAVVAEGEKK